MGRQEFNIRAVPLGRRKESVVFEEISNEVSEYIKLMCSDTLFLDCQNDFRFLKQKWEDDALFLLFIYFPLHPFDGGLEEEQNQMLICTFCSDMT